MATQGGETVSSGGLINVGGGGGGGSLGGYSWGDFWEDVTGSGSSAKRRRARARWQQLANQPTTFEIQDEPALDTIAPAVPGTTGSPIPFPGQTPAPGQPGGGVTLRELLQLAIELLNIFGRGSRQPAPPAPRTIPGQTIIIRSPVPAPGGAGGGARPGPGGTQVPFITMEGGGLFGGNGGGLFGTGITGQDIASVIGAFRGNGGAPMAAPGGAPIGNALVPQVLGGIARTGAAAVGGAALSSMFGGSCEGAFRMGNNRATAQTFTVANPVSGRMTTFKPAGRPVLYSGDLAACKRVKKAGMRARRAAGGR